MLGVLHRTLIRVQIKEHLLHRAFPGVTPRRSRATGGAYNKSINQLIKLIINLRGHITAALLHGCLQSLIRWWLFLPLQHYAVPPLAPHWVSLSPPSALCTFRPCSCQASVNNKCIKILALLPNASQRIRGPQEKRRKSNQEFTFSTHTVLLRKNLINMMLYFVDPNSRWHATVNLGIRRINGR